MKFSIIRDRQPIYSLCGYLKPDKDWFYIDKSGHSHRWDGNKLPSLTHYPAITEFFDCECCGGYDQEIESEYYLCKDCSEKINPKYKTNYGPVYIAGPSYYYIDDQPVFKNEFDEKIKECKYE